MTQELLEQEVRRQAMLQVMGMEVWLPRQQLPHAASTPDWLLSWQSAVSDTRAQPAAQVQQGGRPASAEGAEPTQKVQPTASAKTSLQQVRQALQQEQQGGNRSASAPVSVHQETAPVPETEQVVIGEQEASAEFSQPPVIPRFSLQLLHSGPCLMLTDLSLGEAFQSSDPDFRLLQDICRAAQLPAPQALRQGQPVRWPLLTTGQLAASQDAEAARVCIRDLLELECSQLGVTFVWLLGEQAVRFANAAHDDEADLFSLTTFQEGIRLWNLPSLEQLMQERQLKPELWYHLQKLMPHWVQHD